ncbi:MAG: cytoplasmic protein [Leptospirales bacterium]
MFEELTKEGSLMEETSIRPAYVEAYQYTLSNKKLLSTDSLCGCYHCLKVFNPSAITQWISDAVDGTAVCPHCGIDSVLGKNSGFPIESEFLQKMHNHWL